MLARGFGQTVTQSLAAILLMESKPTAPPVAGVPSVGLKNGDKIPVATRIPFKRRASMEARMRLVTTPGSDLVEEVMMPLEM